MPRIRAIEAQPFETPLHGVFVTSRGSSDKARGVAVLLQLDDGHTVRGESVPASYVTGETRETVLETVQQVGPTLIGMDVSDYAGPIAHIERLAPHQPSARCGMEMAIFLAWSLVHGMSLRRLWGGASSQCETDITIPLVPEAGALAAQAWQRGIRFLKVKVGQSDQEGDLQRVREVHRAAPEALLRLDANQGFLPEEALRFVDTLLNESIPIQLLEQPVAKEDIAGLCYVAQRCPVPVFADESCRTRQEGLRLADTPVHGFNLKINKCGIQGTLDLIAIGRAAGKRLMLGCMLETSHSIAVSAAIACGTGAFEFLDLDGHLLLKEPQKSAAFYAEGGKIQLMDNGATPLFEGERR
ncbi:dipeptide epimerase [Chthonomonas calidirosea]|uniref:dipeptide epimerase n=1 Tax=Chthonomonas calidirosea TaxID=454171 RepID=UPI0006EC7C97|nr:dipeptide epimerase [Chthonomonas calidirosea]CEK17042.1 enolase superfamily enzyme related to L-alanine-DL-glutamate epimerase [Chthonomonas calidirosea]